MKFNIALMASVSLFVSFSVRADIGLVKCDESRTDLRCLSLSRKEAEEIVKFKTPAELNKYLDQSLAQANQAWNEFTKGFYNSLTEAQKVDMEEIFDRFSKNEDGSRMSAAQGGDVVAAFKKASELGENFPPKAKLLLMTAFHRVGTASLMRMTCETNFPSQGCYSVAEVFKKASGVFVDNKVAGGAGGEAKAPGGQLAGDPQGTAKAGDGKKRTGDGDSTGTLRGGARGRPVKILNKLDLELTDNSGKSVPLCILGATQNEKFEGPCPTGGEMFPEVKSINAASINFIKIEAARSQILKSASAYLSLLTAQRGIDSSSALKTAADQMVNACGDPEIKKSLEGMRDAAKGQFGELEAKDSKISVSQAKDQYVEGAVDTARQLTLLDQQIKALSNDFSELPSNIAERWPAMAPCRSVVQVLDQYITIGNIAHSNKACSNHQLSKGGKGGWSEADELLAKWPEPIRTDDQGNPVANSIKWNGLVDAAQNAEKRCDTKAKLLEGLLSTRARMMGQFPELGQLSPGSKPDAAEKRYAYQDIAAKDPQSAFQKMQEHLSEGANSERLADLRRFIRAACADPVATGTGVFEDDTEMKAFMDCTAGLEGSGNASWESFYSGEMKRCGELRQMGALACAARNEVRNTRGKKLEAAIQVGSQVGGTAMDLEFCASMAGGFAKGGMSLAQAAGRGMLKETVKAGLVRGAKALATRKLYANMAKGVAGQLFNPVMAPMLAAQGYQIYKGKEAVEYADAKNLAGVWSVEKRDAMKANLEHGYSEMLRDMVLFGLVGGAMHGGGGGGEGEHFMTPDMESAYQKAKGENGTKADRKAFVELSKKRMAERMGLNPADMTAFFEKMGFKAFEKMAIAEKNGVAEAAVKEARVEAKKDPKGATKKLMDTIFGAKWDLAKEMKEAEEDEANPKLAANPLDATPFGKSLREVGMFGGQSLEHADAKVAAQHLLVSSKNLPEKALSARDKLSLDRDVETAAKAVLKSNDPNYRGEKITPKHVSRARDIAQRELQTHYIDKLDAYIQEAGKEFRENYTKLEKEAAEKIKERKLTGEEAAQVRREATEKSEAFEAYQLARELEGKGNSRENIAKFLKRLTRECPAGEAGIKSALSECGIVGFLGL